jgi:hypothetical protein
MKLIDETKGTWQNMGMYWAWRISTNGHEFCSPPTVKKLDYATVNGQKQCVGVWDDGVYTSLNDHESMPEISTGHPHLICKE